MRFDVGMNAGGRTSDEPSGRGLFVGDDRRQQILGVQNSDDLVECVAKHRKSRVLRTANAIEDFGPRRRLLDANDIDARHHDLLHFGLAERKHAVNQFLFGRRDVRFGGDHFAELFGRRLAVFGVAAAGGMIACSVRSMAAPSATAGLEHGVDDVRANRRRAERSVADASAYPTARPSALATVCK